MDTESEYTADIEEGSNRDPNALNSLSGDGSSEQDYRFATGKCFVVLGEF